MLYQQPLKEWVKLLVAEVVVLPPLEAKVAVLLRALSFLPVVEVLVGHLALVLRYLAMVDVLEMDIVNILFLLPVQAMWKLLLLVFEGQLSSHNLLQLPLLQ